MTDKPDDHITWLTHWYSERCDGDWEHNYGVKIDTLDNPGWCVKIDLRETGLEGKSFETVTFNMDAPDGNPAVRWHHCKVEGMCFDGAGGVHDLMAIVGIFRAWVEQSSSNQVIGSQTSAVGRPRP